MNDYTELVRKLEHNDRLLLREAAAAIRELTDEVARLNTLNSMQEKIIKQQAAQLAMGLWIEK